MLQAKNQHGSTQVLGWNMGMSQNRGAYMGAPNLCFLKFQETFSGAPILRHSHIGFGGFGGCTQNGSNCSEQYVAIPIERP